MSQTKAYRIAMIGCGGRGREHAKGLRADDRCEVVAVCDLKRDAAEAMNADFGFAATIYEDYAEMLRREKPDVVTICLWTALRLPVFQACVDAGVRAVLCEKPMAPTWGESVALSQLSETSGVQLTFCHQRRFCSGNLLVRKLLAEGTIGKVERMDLYSPKHLIDCGTHTYDQAMSFNGETPAKWALGAIDTSAMVSNFDLRAEAMAVGTVVFANGVRSNLQVGGPDADMGSGVRIYGSEGILAVDWDGNFKQATVYADPAWEPPVVTKVPDETMIGVVRNALDSLTSGAEPELSHRKALRAAEILFALYQSVRRRQRIELPLSGFTDNPYLTMLDHGEFESAPAADPALPKGTP
jgi:UDP-N-acetyl-2-amino-2-deoxyglucuronate dehydrogenase